MNTEVKLIPAADKVSESVKGKLTGGAVVDVCLAVVSAVSTLTFTGVAAWAVYAATAV